MDIGAKEQYMKTLRREYLKGSKKKKGEILDEYCKNTGQERRYVGKKFRYKVKLKEVRKKRKEYYDSYTKVALAKMWKIFDLPCGQRLKPLLETETDRMRNLKELICSNETAEKLKVMGSATIDRKLEHEREIEKLKRKYHKKKNPLLFQKIPVKVFEEQDRSVLGNVQIDLVEHCGQSASGEYACSLSNTDISSGWWEGEAVMGKGQFPCSKGLNSQKERFPFDWKEIHSDNGTSFINYHLIRWTEKRDIGFSRSRPYKKNDNCLVEQKNWTHVKKFVGYLRYDTQEELDILNDLYRNELRLYKNFFQPVIKLVLKERVGGKIYRKYDKAKTPYYRVMECNEVSEKKKRELKEIYESLNPAQLKRDIDKKLDMLYVVYQKKKGLSVGNLVKIDKKLKTSMVSF